MLAIFLLAGAVVMGMLIVMRWKYPAYMGTEGKTLWDWVALLHVPATVGLGTIILTYSQYVTERDRARDLAVLTYVDRASALLLTVAPAPLDDNRLRILQAQTVTVLHMVEGERAGRVIGFLAGLDLLNRLDLEFETLDLSGADLKSLDLRGVDLEGSSLQHAELERSDLRGADFEEADLSGADLKEADLRNTLLDRANLSDADLDHTLLQGSDLRHARGIKLSQLRLACLDQTTLLPPGMTLQKIAPEGCSGQVRDD